MSNVLKLAKGMAAAGGGSPAFSTYGTASAAGSATSISVSYASGDFIVVLCGHDRGGATWTADTAFLSNSTARIGSAVSGQVFWGVASSSGSTVAMSESAKPTEASSYIAMVFTDSSTGTVGTASGLSANPNPPSLAGFSGTNIAVAMAAVDLTRTLSAVPSGYTQIALYTGPRNAVGAAYYLTPSSTEDPGTFTASSSDNWAAFTMRIAA